MQKKLACAVTCTAFGVFVVSCGDSGPSQRVGRSASRLTGINVLDESGSKALPEAAVSFLTTSDQTCTATVIARRDRNGNGLLLTAAHCMCPSSVDSSIGLTSRTDALAARPDIFVGTSIGTSEYAFGGLNICVGEVFQIPGIRISVDPDSAISDLAIVELDGPLSIDRFPNLPRVYSGDDFLDRIFNVRDTTFFAPPYLVTGAQANTKIQILQGTITDTIHFDQDCGFLGLGTCSPHWIAVDRGAGPLVERGDSGGPITFQGPDNVPVIFGVVSLTHTGVFTDDDRYSPTWGDRGSGNGAFIRQFLVDADEDGVDDRIDNAPPSACPDDPFQCANPDQADRDNDGFGDVIDNCPPSVCERRGLNPQACANSAQIDADSDGTGDACDSCALTPNGQAAVGGDAFRGDASQYADTDGDGVGDACDNCHDVPNPFQACTPVPGCNDKTAACTSADCASGACVGFPFLGKCSVSGTTCGSDAACPINTAETHETCVIGFGRCTLQNDDPDNDHLGNACDSCPLNNDTRITANSNVDAESVIQEASNSSLPSLGDHCDPVPQLVSRGIVGTLNPTGQPVASDPRASTTSYTTFFGTAGIGVGASPPLLAEKAGFRRCDCIRTNADGTTTTLVREECVQAACPPAADSYVVVGGVYGKISTATSTDITRLPTATVMLGEEVRRTFTSDVQCDISFKYRSSSDICRVGAQRQITLWDHVADVSANRAKTESGAGLITAGLVMSHVLSTSRLATSARDAANPGLRDTLEYVKTPLVDFVAGSATRQFQDCVFAGCMMTWRFDWFTNPADTFRVDPTPLESFGYYGRLAAQRDNSIVMLGRSTDAVFDVSSALTFQTAALIRSGSFSFLTPVEEGVSGARGAASIATIVAMPSAWRQSVQRPLSLVASGGRLAVVGSRFSSFASRASSATAAANPPVHPFGDPHFIPGDRDGSRSVFSGTEQAVYMVGGHRLAPDGTVAAPSGEVWRYDLAADVWRHLFVGENVGTQPGDVRAIAYDNTSGRIVIVDDGVGGGPPFGKANGRGPTADGPPGPRFGRLVLIDTIAHKVQAVAKLPRTDKYARIALVHRGNGEYVLLRAKKDRSSFSASAFRLGADGSARWIGKQENAGEMLDDPFRTPQGILLPVGDNGVQDLVFVKTGSSRRANDPDDAPEDL